MIPVTPLLLEVSCFQLVQVFLSTFLPKTNESLKELKISRFIRLIKRFWDEETTWEYLKRNGLGISCSVHREGRDKGRLWYLLSLPSPPPPPPPLPTLAPSQSSDSRQHPQHRRQWPEPTFAFLPCLSPADTASFSRMLFLADRAYIAQGQCSDCFFEQLLTFQFLLSSLNICRKMHDQ